MIGFITLFFLGKVFYKLADEYQKQKWLFAILAILSYYLGTLLGGFIIFSLATGFEITAILEMDDRVFGLFGIPFGVLTCWGLYRYLRSQWEKGEQHAPNGDALDRHGK